MISHPFPPHQFITDPAELITYEVDAGFDRAAPDGVFFPESTADVSRVLAWAATHDIPLTARGAGTGLAGGAIAKQGGVILVFSRMNRIVKLDRSGRSVTVEAGAVNLDVDAAANAAGLYYPPDPSSGRSAHIGGNLGTNAGGPHCFKYGVTTNYVTGLEAVLADGEVVQLGGQALDYPEYDLCGLVVGSEGTLAVITQADLRLIRTPPGVMTMMVAFESAEQAGQAVSAVIAAGLVPATLELMDQRGMRIIEEFTSAGLPVDAGAALIVEVDGYPGSLHTQAEEVADLLAANGGFDIRIAQSEAERAQIWYGRKSAAGALARLAPTYYLTDVTVRRSLLGETLRGVRKICERYDVITASFFHAGDGNLHPLIPMDPSDPEQITRVHQAAEAIFDLCLGLDGSITGEHGVGVEKRKFMARMYDSTELSAMYDVKQVFDPANRLNPGKVLPEVIQPAERVPARMPDESVWTPGDANEAAAGLRACTEAGRAVAIGHAVLAGDAALRLSTAALQGVRVFAPEDLFITVGAGMTVADVQAVLAERGLQASVAAPWPSATVGGLIAANINGPARMRYGSLRDNLLCATVALADGRVIRAGRPLVKNVAGYDLPKVFVGSWGTLGLLTDVTLKLTPLPRVRRTLVAPVADLADGLALADVARAQALVSAGIVLVHAADVPGLAGDGLALLYTAEGMAEDVEEELDGVTAALRRAGASLVAETGLSAGMAWQRFLREQSRPEDEQALLVRLGVPVTALAETLAQAVAHKAQESHLLVDCAAGFVHATPAAAAPLAPAAAGAWLNALRQPALRHGGYASIQVAGADYQELDRWGYRPTGMGLMRRLKQRWDPQGILNPGLFVVGND